MPMSPVVVAYHSLTIPLPIPYHSITKSISRCEGRHVGVAVYYYYYYYYDFYYYYNYYYYC